MSNSEKTNKAPQNQRDDSGFSLREWFTGIKSEFKRVTWPGRDEVIKMTVTVIATSAVVGVIIIGFDAVIAAAYNFIFSF